MSFNSYFRRTSSPRYTNPDRGAVRLGVRTLEALIKIPEECIPGPVKEFDPAAPPFLPPRLRHVFEVVKANGNGGFKTSIIQIEAMLNTYAQIERPVYPPLQRVWATFPDLALEADWHIEQSAYLTTPDSVAGVPQIGTPTVN
jgi:hypothetical protein